MACKICKLYLGVTRTHPTGECPQGGSVLCTCCRERGHATADCPDTWAHWERPKTLEELIPPDIRRRYNITSHTPIVYDTPRSLPEREDELGEINTLEILDDYAVLNKFVETHDIKVEKVTKPSREKFLEAILAWAAAHGKRIRLVPETGKN